MPAALSDGRISAYIVAEPFGAISISHGSGKVLYDSQELWQDSLCCTLVLRDEFINNNRLVAEEFVREYVKASEKAEQKDEDVYEVSSKYMKTKKDVLELSLKFISYKDLAIRKEEYQVLTDYMKEMGLSENPPAYEDFIDNSLIQGE
jgi:NitT/TauT family transport system substrate-binding protein